MCTAREGEGESTPFPMAHDHTTIHFSLFCHSVRILGTLAHVPSVVFESSGADFESLLVGTWFP